MNVSKKISYLYLIISVLFFSFIFYRSEIQFNDNNDYYSKYYIISILLIFFSIISFFLKKIIKIQITLVIFFGILGFYIWEAILIKNYGSRIKENIFDEKNIEKYFNQTGLKYDTRSKKEVFKKLKGKDKNAIIAVYPSYWLQNKNKKILPLSGKSLSKTLDCNENGYFSIYNSDRYGFNNIDKNWDKKEIDYLLIGDSFVHGQCVYEKDTISGNLRKLKDNKKGILNLGYSSTSILAQYATLKEYFPNKKVNNILYFYHEGNDLKGLSTELKDDIFKNYISDQKYSQNLKNRQQEIDNLIDETVKASLFKPTKNDEFSFVKFFKLTNFREIYLNNLFYSPNQKEFFQILQLMKKFSDKKKTNFYFVYLPEYFRYAGIDNKNSNKYSEIIKTVKKMNINIIDLHDGIIQAVENPLNLYPFGNFGHFNEIGYETVAKIILKKIKN